MDSDNNNGSANCGKCDSQLEKRRLELRVQGEPSPEFREVSYCPPCSAYYVGNKRFTNGERKSVAPAALKHGYPSDYWKGFKVISSRFVSLEG